MGGCALGGPSASASRVLDGACIHATLCRNKDRRIGAPTWTTRYPVPVPGDTSVRVARVGAAGGFTPGVLYRAPGMRGSILME